MEIKDLNVYVNYNFYEVNQITSAAPKRYIVAWCIFLKMAELKGNIKGMIRPFFDFTFQLCKPVGDLFDCFKGLAFIIMRYTAVHSESLVCH